jgi:hypothetical protein
VLSQKEKPDIHCGFTINAETMWKLRRMAAEKRFHSVADMMRYITQDFLREEENEVS